MASFIKSLKVKKEDGTWSEEMPLGANSDYIICEHGSLTMMLNAINKQLKEIKDHLDALDPPTDEESDGE